MLGEIAAGLSIFNSLFGDNPGQQGASMADPFASQRGQYQTALQQYMNQPYYNPFLERMGDYIQPQVNPYMSGMNQFMAIRNLLDPATMAQSQRQGPPAYNQYDLAKLGFPQGVTSGKVNPPSTASSSASEKDGGIGSITDFINYTGITGYIGEDDYNKFAKSYEKDIGLKAPNYSTVRALNDAMNLRAHAQSQISAG